MSADEQLLSELAAAIESGKPFGSQSETIEVPAPALREAILSRKDGATDPGLLWLRNVRVNGHLNFDACTLRPRLKFDDCEFSGTVSLLQANALDLRLHSCTLNEELLGDQFTVRWNLTITRSKVQREASLTQAKIGGQLIIANTKLNLRADLTDLASCALDIDRATVGGGVYLTEVYARGEVRMYGARIGGALTMLQTTLNGSRDRDGDCVSLTADGIQVADDITFKDLAASGEIRLLEARIGGGLLMKGATVTGEKNQAGIAKAISMDRGSVVGDTTCHDLVATGEIRLLSAKLGGTLDLRGASLKAISDGDDETAALSVAGIEVMGDVIFDGLTAIGSITMPDAKIGSLMMRKTVIRQRSREDNDLSLNADGIQVANDVLCDKLEATGTIQMSKARLGGRLSLRDAKLEGLEDEDGEVWALSADGMEVESNVTCKGLMATGLLLFSSVTLRGQLELFECVLRSGCTQNPALSLVRGKVNELILSFKKIGGAVDLRRASVNTLWDAQSGEFMGEMPDRLRLEGFTYKSLHEPLDADKRLPWIEIAQGDKYYPGVYVELSDAFRRIGCSGDARKVELASERRAIQQLKPWRPRWLWRKLLWVTTGSGYRNWLAAAWLLGLLAVGSLIFWHCEGAFTPIRPLPASFSPILYAVDVTVPVVDIGQQGSWAPSGWLRWVSLFLVVSGYALVTAVVAAAAGLLNRDPK